MVSKRLPTQFVELERHIDRWALQTSAERIVKRVCSDMTEITDFYNSVTPRLAEIVEYLASVPYESMSSQEDRNLLALSLSLAELAPAVEWYKQPRVLDGYDMMVYTVAKEFP